MQRFYRAKRLDNLVLVCVGFLILALLALAIVGSQLRRRVSPSPDSCGAAALPTAIESILRNHPRGFIALVGDGVPGQTLVTDRPYNTQYAQGYDLYQGVQHALTNSMFRTLLAKIGVLLVDDGGNPRCAAAIATVLSQRPELIAIIGHSTTSCTMAALPTYKKANIPVIIPAATNPTLLTRDGEHCFRLPSNDYVQSFVIADIIVHKFKARSVFIIWDATNEAQQYSEYIKNQVQYFLTAPAPLSLTREEVPVIEGSYPISLNPLNYTYLFRRIVSSDADVVVFAGYGSLAREFLLGLNHEYAAYPDKRLPKVLLTDGCKIPGIQSYNFDTYITFAAKPLKSFSAFANFDAGTPIGGFQKMYLTESFEVFGYDAMVILLSAIGEGASRGALSREQLISLIGDRTRQYATAYPYEFDGGENIRNRYYCYSVPKDAIAFAYEENDLTPMLQRASRHQ